jgi:predicted nucleic acid-binding protein
MEEGRQEVVARFVADASVICTWVLPDESHPIADATFARLRTDQALAPDLFWYEIRSVLIIAFRRKRISFPMMLEGMETLRRLNIVTVAMGDDPAILELANKYNLSAYDAAYLALALQQNLKLATLDKHLIAAAAQAGCALVSA